MAQVGAVRGIVNMQLLRGEARALLNALADLGDKSRMVCEIEEKLIETLDPQRAA